MNLELTDEQRAYRERLRRHISANRPAMPRPPGTRSPDPADLAIYRTWIASLFSGGFLGAEWPTAWGGTSHRDPIEDYVLDQELAAAAVPRPVGAYNLVAGPLLAFGSEDQQEHYLPRIRAAQDLWCQLFSEPEAGSDLASLRTKATRENDEWVIDGQKVWTTHAHIADLGFLLARTDSTVSKHDGITAFIVDMRSPGIDVRPLRELSGSSDFNEVFLDDVRVPHSNVIGAPGQGWAIARTALAHERGQSVREDSTAQAVLRLVSLARQVGDHGGPMIDRADVRRRIGELAAQAQVSDLLGLQGIIRDASGTANSTDAAVAKVMFSETNLEIATYGVELQGSFGILDERDVEAIDAGRWQEAFLWARGYTISAGSNEILRNLIAERGLGLPRDPSAR